MKNDSSCDSYVQTGSFICVLRDIDEVITDFFVHGQNSSAFIAQENGRIAFKRMALHRLTCLPDLYSTDTNPIFLKVILGLCKRIKRMELDLIVGSLVAKTVKFLDGLDFFASLGAIGDVKDFRKAKCACRANNGADISLFADVMQEEIALGRALFVHSLVIQLVEQIESIIHAILIIILLIICYQMDIEEVSFDTFRQQHEELKELINRKDFKAVLKKISFNLASLGLPYLLYLHAYKFLEMIWAGLLKEKAVFTDAPSLFFLPERLFPGFYGEINKKCHNYLDEIKFDDNYKELFKDKSNYEMNMCQKQKNEELGELLKRLFEIKSKNLKGREVSDIQKEVMEFQIEANLYMEISLNWMKELIDREIRQNDQYLCCKCFFRRDEIITAIENKNQEFKRYTWPITAQNIKNHIKKTIVGFLNMYGGIIYVGVYEDKLKKNIIEGVKIDSSKLKDVYDFFKALTKEVYPQHEGFEPSNESSYARFDYGKTPINDYINLEFIPVVEKEEYYNVHQVNHNEKCYIIKLFVKIGYPKHLYHLISNDQMIDFFVREDRNVEKKAFPDAHAMIYDRLDKFDLEMRKPIPTFIRNQFHNNCQYEMALTRYELEDLEFYKDSDSDDDDDDD